MKLVHGVLSAAALAVPLAALLAHGGEPRATIGSIVDVAAASYMSDPQSVGLSIGVLKDGEGLTFNYGTLRRGARQKPTARTVYPIASITKTFTGTLLAQAAIERKLSLDDDVRKFLDGDFPNLEFQGQPVRLVHLLNHRSGLPFLLPDRPELMPGYQNEPAELHVARLAGALAKYGRSGFLADLRLVKLDAAPGERFRYSNAAAQLAGFVLESIHGRSFEELLRQKVTRPLRMEDTSITLGRSQRDRLATGYEGQGPALPPPSDELQGAGALKSTAADMLKYLRWQVAEADEAVKLSHRPTFTDGSYATGLNWQIVRSGDRRVVWQEGTVPGFTSYCVFEPESGLGLVVLSNESDRSSSRRLSSLINEVLRALDERSVLLPQ